MLRERVARLLLLGALFGGGTASAEEFTLRFRPEVGTRLEVSQVIEQNTTTNMAAMGSQEMQSSVRMDSTQTVLDVEDAGTRRVEFVLDRVAMSVRQGDQEMMSLDTDSEDDAADPSLAVFGMMVGEPYVVQFDELGAVLGIEGLSDLLDQAMASAGDPQSMAILRQAFSEEAVRQTMEMSMPVFETRPVGIGDRWSRQLEMDIPALGTVEVAAVYQVEALSEYAGEPCVRLGAKMAMEFDLDSPMLNQLAAGFGSAAEIQMDADDAEATGWMCIASSDGVTLESEVHNELAMGISIEMEGQPAIEMQIELDQITRQTATR